MPAHPSTRSVFLPGALLNLALPGAGFTLLGRWPLHLAWAAALPLLAAAGAALSGPLGNLLPLLLLPLLGQAGLLRQYLAAARQPARPLGMPARVGLLLLGALLSGASLFLTVLWVAAQGLRALS